MRKIKYIFEAIIVYVLLIMIKIIGLQYSRKLFSLIFIKLGPLIKSKKVVIDNLNKINGKNEILEKDEIINKMWSNYGKTFVEYIFLKRFKENDSHINFKNEHILQNIISQNKSVIFVSGHFANFELMTMELTKRNVNVATIYRPLNNFLINPFMEYLRKKYICKNQIKKGLAGVKSSINYLKKNHSIALMIDQRVSEGEKIPFFNHLAFTSTLPAQLAIKNTCDIVPIYISRDCSDKFQIEFFEPISTVNSKNETKDKINITKELNEILEKMILKDPSQWILTHNRWK